MRAPKPFATETDLCAAFLAAVPDTWTAWKEHAGWDILLVRKADGFQIGIEAKLKCNATVLQQALEEYGTIGVASEGPDCRAILVPESEGTLKPLADYLGITVIQMRVRDRWSGPLFLPSLPEEPDQYSNHLWHEWLPTKRHALLEYLPHVPAGAPAPLQLTWWKIQAMKLVILATTRGYVTREDFKHLRIDHRMWVGANGWLRPTERKGWYFAEGTPPFALKEQHPRVYAEIEADADKWMPKVAT